MNNNNEIKNLSIATTYEIDDSFDSEKLIKLKLRICHDGINPNKSKFNIDTIESASETIKNIPILANVIFDENGDPQFGGHDMEIEKDKTKDDEYRIIYHESPIGLIPENCNHKIEKFNDKNYAYCDAYIWRGYSNYAEDIINRDKDIKLSMEILVDAYSYDAKEKCYNITDYRYKGITLLNKDYGTGMENAMATTTDFSEDSKTQMIVMMDELKQVLLSYNKQFSEEGGAVLENEKVETVVENTETQTSEEVVETNNGEEVVEQTFEENNSEGAEATTDTIEEVVITETTETTETTEQSNEETKFVKSFELSHNDIRAALYALLAPIEEEDQAWYWISEVFDTYFYYESGYEKYFKQTYKKDGDLVSFDGDRVEMFKEMLTKEEKDALENMRANYSELKEFKETKMAEEYNNQIKDIFDRFEKLIGEIDEFKALKENYSELSVNDVFEKCCAINGKKNINFSLEKTKTNSIKIPVGIETNEQNDNNTKKPYGGLVEKFTNKTK